MQKEISNYKIGLLGGGQLGRMLLQSAMDLNLEVAIMDANPNAPCAHLVQHFTVGKLTDYEDVIRFGQDKDLITIEIENVNIEALKALEATGVKVYPQPHIIELIQDKRKQKNFYLSTGIPTADFVLTESKADVLNYVEMIPAVHKLGTEGYDGRGVQMIRTAADTHKAFDRPGILEKCIDFSLVLGDFGGGEATGGRWCRGPSQTPKLKEKHQKTKLELECLVFGKYKGLSLRCLVFNPHSHRRAKRGGG